MKDSPKYVSSYRANFHTENGVECTLKSESLTELQAQIQHNFPQGKIRLDSGQSPSAQSIFINDKWTGFITKLEVPASETVRVRTEQRQAMQRAA